MEGGEEDGEKGEAVAREDNQRHERGRISVSESSASDGEEKERFHWLDTEGMGVVKEIREGQPDNDSEREKAGSPSSFVRNGTVFKARTNFRVSSTRYHG